jgi:urate oxidase
MTKEEKPVTQQAEEIYSLCNKIITTEIPSPIHAFMENAIPSLQKEIYNLGDKILGITGLSNIHKLMSIAMEMHCNEEIMYSSAHHEKSRTQENL